MNGIPLSAVAAGWVTMLKLPGLLAVSAIGAELSGVSPGAVNVIVYDPIGPLIRRPVNVAAPVALVVAVVAPPRVPALGRIEALMRIPDVPTGFPD